MQKDRPQDSILTGTLQVLAVVALMGFLYCAMLILGLLHTTTVNTTQVLVYGGWFAACVISVVALLNHHRWGAYGLLFATLIVALVELLTGVATLGGAILGAFILVLVVAYLYADSNTAG